MEDERIGGNAGEIRTAAGCSRGVGKEKKNEGLGWSRGKCSRRIERVCGEISRGASPAVGDNISRRCSCRGRKTRNKSRQQKCRAHESYLISILYFTHAVCVRKPR